MTTLAKPCATSKCSRPAAIRITFIDGKKIDYCAKCAAKIGGKQTKL